MRRLLLLLALALALGASACGGGDDSSAPGGTTTAAEQIKVGLVTDINQLNDRGFNALAFKGMKRAERQLGIRGACSSRRSAADYVPNMTALARQGYDLIVGVGFVQGNAVATASKRFPQTKFTIIDVDQSSCQGSPRTSSA